MSQQAQPEPAKGGASELPEQYNTQYGGFAAQAPPVDAANPDGPPPAYTPAMYPQQQMAPVGFNNGQQQPPPQYLQQGAPGYMIPSQPILLQAQPIRQANYQCAKCQRGFYLNPATTARLVICPHCRSRQSRDATYRTFAWLYILVGVMFIVGDAMLVAFVPSSWVWIGGFIIGVVFIARGIMISMIPRAVAITPTGQPVGNSSA